jgi:hypothetical protein
MNGKTGISGSTFHFPGILLKKTQGKSAAALHGINSSSLFNLEV